MRDFIEAQNRSVSDTTESKRHVIMETKHQDSIKTEDNHLKPVDLYATQLRR